jgi:hypothetical protein
MVYIKRIFSVTVMCLLFMAAFAQKEDSLVLSDSKKLTKEQKAAQKKFNADAKAKIVEWMAKNQQFVMESNYVNATGGTRISVNPTTNYIEVDSTRITVQVSSISGIGGQNGIGGFTMDGDVNSYKWRTFGKNKDGYNIDMIVMSQQGTFEVFMSIFPDGNAEASVGGNRVGKINFTGFMLPINKAKTIKGLTTH